MATKSKASADPTQAREQAERHRDAVAEALSTAQAHLSDLETRLADGDSSVTAEALSTAQADVQRQGLLHQAAERALEEAQIAEGIHVAETVAREIASTTMTDLAAAHQKAVEGVERVLAEYQATLESSNKKIRSAIDAAKRAGLTVGQADPLSPVVVESERIGGKPVYGRNAKVPSRDVLILGGERYQQASIDDAMRQVTTEALAGRGVEL